MFLAKVEDLWFPDGNIIIQAESSLFRVYQGFLSARSEVLDGMFMVPQPPTSLKAPKCKSPLEDEEEVLHNMEDTMDGCPLVRFHDTALDTKYFLRAVFHSGYFEPPPSRPAMPIILAVLRLSHKYDVAYLRRRALQHLSYIYPSSLESFISYTATMWITCFLEICGSIIKPKPATSGHASTTPPVNSELNIQHTGGLDYKSMHFAAARVADEVGATWLIPTILYWCTIYGDVEDLVYGAPPVTPVPPTAKYNGENTCNNEHRIQLPRDYGVRCIKLKSAAVLFSSPLLAASFLTARPSKSHTSLLTSTPNTLPPALQPIHDPSPGCLSPKACLSYRHRILVAALSASEYGPNLFKFQNSDFWKKVERKLCGVCFRAFVRAYDKGRITFWRELPDCFGVGENGWEGLYRQMSLDLAGEETS